MEQMPLLSIHCITYNHEKYIRQAIESFVAQQTSFDFEIVVGEDCSTDGTRKILLELRDQYPDKIRLILNDTNIGMQPNFLKTIAACRGKYIATCEGDDYWVDIHKIQKQVDLLEANEGYAAVAGLVRYRIEKKNIEIDKTGMIKPDKTDFTVEDFLNGTYMSTATILFRRSAFDPSFIRPDFLISDRFLQISLTLKGKMHLLKDVVAVYRVHSEGSMHTFIPKNKSRYYSEYIEFYRHFNSVTNKQYEEVIQRRLSYFSDLLLINTDSAAGVKKFFVLNRFFFMKSEVRSVREYMNLVASAYPTLWKKLKKTFS